MCASSATAAATPIFCSTSRMVSPRAFRARIVSTMSPTMVGARPADGSSISRHRGRAIRARPIATICCSPPLKLPARRLRPDASLGNIAKISSMSERIAAQSRRVAAPSSRLSCTDMLGQTSRPCGTWAMPWRTTLSGERPAHSRPSNRIEPPLGVTRPDSVFSIVVLPDPLPPSRATILPAGTSKVTSRRTSVRPYETLRC